MERRGRWPGVDSGIEDVALVILEWLAEQGVSAMIRVDPERLAEGLPPWTFAAGGGPLRQGMRTDGASADECLSRALSGLRAAGVDVPY